MDKHLNYLPLGASVEKDLVAGLCKGEPASYRHLYDRFAPRLLRILQRIFADTNLANDAVQATFLIVFQKIDGFDGRSSLLTWITRIGIRQAQHLLRAGNRRPAPEQVAGMAVVAEGEHLSRSPEQQHGDHELYRQMTLLLAALPEDKRAALLLFEVEGFSVQQIADITGEPRGTVLSRLSRTRLELRQQLEAWCERGALGREDGRASGGKNHVQP